MNFEEIYKKLNINFKNPNLIKEALTHRSFLHENKGEQLNNNERLEFLGDAILELVVSEFLFVKYPNNQEGELTSFRAALVKTESLAEEALRLGIGEFILMSKGEEATGGRERPYILANTFEAIIGAIYLDSNYQSAAEFIQKNICYKLDKIVEGRLDIDSKSKLQELTQEQLRITPHYELISSEGPDHNKVFEMGLFINDKMLSSGNGKSKQEAEQNAARSALENWDEISKGL